MCVYISITPDGTEIESRYNKKFIPQEKDLFTGLFFAQAFNNPKLPVVTKNENIQIFEWGLIPSWTKDQKSADEIRKKTYNARSETIFEKPSFRNPVLKKRCLVIADGFFEWREFAGKKYPYYIRLKSGELFSLAGIYDTWNDKNTFSIITTDANDLMKKIHNTKQRMPVILKKEEENKWLDESLNREEISIMLSAYDDKLMEAYPVSRLLTTKGTRQDDPHVIEKTEYKELD
jgi:putative SOS response-associated peptidase YedK